ncbi:molybdopterin-dependent oxidoreductase [Lichenihabitans psoromatis]|uniref:molybdopterin-dependent oxidoreductase n=1 Tax=Lichenihabitans psoromatis TaxID=2528642 RepID=UPI0010384D2B|nr:molybdopterin-dependent oxidoreductase [Lichenihabitans psoromatis]
MQTINTFSAWGFAGLLAGLALLNAPPAFALDAPTGKPILVITGDITETNDKDTAKFDRAMLEKLGMVKIETKTPWYDGVMTFEGVPLDKLMAVVGAKGHTVQALALNDYSTNIPIDDFAKFHTILALKRNGEYMPVRDKGPLFVVYPYDSNPDLQSQTYYSRSAWQVSRFIIK